MNSSYLSYFANLRWPKVSISKITCPSCGAGLRLTGVLPVGKRIKCPKCSDAFVVPEEEEEERKPQPRQVVEEVDDDEPEEEERAPERRPAARKPRKKPTKKAASKTPLILGLLAGVVVLVAAGGGLAFVLSKRGQPQQQASSTPTSQPADAPAGAGGAATPGGDAGAGGGSGDGRQVFETQCARCHSPAGGGSGGKGKGRGKGPDLSGIGSDARHTVESITTYVRDPKSVKPDSRMPAFGTSRISADDLRSLATFLKAQK